MDKSPRRITCAIVWPTALHIILEYTPGGVVFICAKTHDAHLLLNAMARIP
jgi:hypothetical protein